MRFSVNENGMTIRYIKNPSDEIVKMAIKQNPLCIQFIENVSDEHIRLALSYNVAAIQFIKEPRKSIVEYAIKLDPHKMERYQLNDDGYYKKKNHLLKNVDNINLLPENEIVSLLEKDGNLLKYIENPNSTMIATAVKKNPLSICWVHNPATEVMRIAVEGDPNSMKKYVLNEENNVVLKSNDEKDSIFQIVMSSMNEQEKLFYFRKDASFMKNMEEVPFEMQIVAIKKNYLNLRYINKIDPRIYLYLYDDPNFDVYSLTDDFAIQLKIVTQFEKIKKSRENNKEKYIDMSASDKEVQSDHTDFLDSAWKEMSLHLANNDYSLKLISSEVPISSYINCFGKKLNVLQLK
ncbi:MAG: hypothetical protein ACRC7V_03445 [Lachnospiraceae bacterium]